MRLFESIRSTKTQFVMFTNGLNVPLFSRLSGLVTKHRSSWLASALRRS